MLFSFMGKIILRFCFSFHLLLFVLNMSATFITFLTRSCQVLLPCGLLPLHQGSRTLPEKTGLHFWNFTFHFHRRVIWPALICFTFHKHTVLQTCFSPCLTKTTEDVVLYFPSTSTPWTTAKPAYLKLFLIFPAMSNPSLCSCPAPIPLGQTG